MDRLITSIPEVSASAILNNPSFKLREGYVPVFTAAGLEKRTPAYRHDYREDTGPASQATPVSHNETVTSLDTNNTLPPQLADSELSPLARRPLDRHTVYVGRVSMNTVIGQRPDDRRPPSLRGWYPRTHRRLTRHEASSGKYVGAHRRKHSRQDLDLAA